MRNQLVQACIKIASSDSYAEVANLDEIERNMHDKYQQTQACFSPRQAASLSTQPLPVA
jgi:hypothetical protein